jgi:hypothetical protein
MMVTTGGLVRASPWTSATAMSCCVVIERLIDSRHDAHLEQRADYLGSLDRQLLRQVGDGNRLADGDFAHDRCGRTGKAMRPGRLTPGIGCARTLLLPARAPACPVGLAQVQLTGEDPLARLWTRWLARTLGARAVPALVGPLGRHRWHQGRIRNGGHWFIWLRLNDFGDQRRLCFLASLRFRRQGSRFGLLAQSLGLGTLGLGFAARGFFRLLLLARLFKFAQGVAALVGLLVANLGALDVGALCAHLDSNRCLGLAGRDGQLFDLATLEGYLFRRGIGAGRL